MKKKKKSIGNENLQHVFKSNCDTIKSLYQYEKEST